MRRTFQPFSASIFSSFSWGCHCAFGSESQVARPVAWLAAQAMKPAVASNSAAGNFIVSSQNRYVTGRASACSGDVGGELIPDRQPPDPLAGRREDGVAKRGRDRDRQSV